MAKMHSKKKGKSGSKKPTTKVVPEWVEFSAQEVEEFVLKHGKEGMSAAAIGQLLRDSYGIPSVKTLTGKSITKILKDGGVKIDYPEDLLNLMKRAVRVRRHMKENRGDVHNKVKLIHIESKIRRRVNYYRRAGILPRDWAYTPEQAELLVK
ncbi:MAG: 30S ribosomal protein S15 [Candidatus Micrarchaeota archaeon]